MSYNLMLLNYPSPPKDFKDWPPDYKPESFGKLKQVQESLFKWIPGLVWNEHVLAVDDHKYLHGNNGKLGDGWVEFTLDTDQEDEVRMVRVSLLYVDNKKGFEDIRKVCRKLNCVCYNLELGGFF